MSSSLSKMMAKAVVVDPGSHGSSSHIAVETNDLDDLDRILALPRRIPFNCVRDPVTKQYEPRTQALVELITSRFTRGERLSCACRPRVVQRRTDGSLVVFRVLPEGLPPEPPLVTTVEAFVADCSTVITAEVEVAREVLKLRPGGELQLPAADGEVGHVCIKELSPVQSWVLYEAPICGGVVGYIVVGGGKCVHFSTEVFDVSQGRRRLVSDFGPLSVPSFDGTKIISKEGQAFPSGVKKCCDLLLADGTKITLSLDHKIYTGRGWVRADCLTTDDFVAVPTKIPEPICVTIVSDDEISLVALMLADGGCTTGTLHFTDDNETVIKEFLRLAEIVCGGASEGKPKSEARNFNLLRAFSGIHNLVEGTGFRNKWELHELSKNKRVKDVIWGLPDRQVALFVNRFWGCDGHVGKDRLECTLASEGLIDDIRFLLLRLGVRARKHYKLAKCKDKYFDSWRIQIRGKDALAFLNIVGDVLGSEGRCHKLRAYLTSTNRNTNFDVVPIGPKEISEICDELGLPTDARTTRHLNPGARTRSDVRKFFHQTNGQFVSRDRFVEFCDDRKYVGKYCKFSVRDVAWERVEKIVDVGYQTVCDLSVPETENFVANGMIVHNSICGLLSPLAFADCKLAVLLGEPGQRRHYRSQYLRLREHFRTPSFVMDDGPGWTVPGTPPLHFVPYSKLSSQSSTDLLERLDPDLVIEDEAHRALGDSARGRRVGRFFTAKIREREKAIAEGRPVLSRAVRLLAWSGTLEARSVKDTQKVCAFALGTGSPLPIDKHEAERWSPVMDPVRQPDRTSSTARRLQLAFAGMEFDSSSIASMLSGGPESAVRKGFCERRMKTLGIVTTTSPSIAASIAFHKFDVPKLPEAVREALTKVRAGVRPDGDLLAEKAKQVMCAQAVSCGFFPYWRFDQSETDEKIAAWFAARKSFFREMRGQLQFAEIHLDSENLCRRAAQRYWRGRDASGQPIVTAATACNSCGNEGSATCATCKGKGVDIFEDSCETCKGEGRVPCEVCGGACVGIYQGDLPVWPSVHWPAWCAIKDEVKHEERVRWIGQATSTQPAILGTDGHVVGEFVARSVAAWAKENKGVVWCKSRVLGNKIAQIAGLPYHDGGPGGEERLRAEKGNRSVIVSIRAFGFGFDSLQEKFSEQVVVEFPASNLVAEQVMGRLLRPGQLKDEVVTRACLHTTEMMDALRKAVIHAEFNSEMLSSSQSLLAADFSFDF